MTIRTLVLFLALAFYLSPVTVSADSGPPAVFRPELRHYPDLTQTDPRGGFAGGGKQFCAPVIISNSLIRLSNQGMLPLTQNDQYAFVRRLASKKYLNSNLKHGTGTKAVLRGVERYLGDNGVTGFSLTYQGWRPHQKRFSSGLKVPNLSWMKATLAQKGALWLNIGWYAYHATRGEYRRIGGHWVEAIGFGLRRDGTRDATYITIHDPAPRAGQSKREHYTKLESMSSGTFVGPKNGLPQPASGYFQLGGEFRVKKKADYGIIDAAVALRLK